MSLRNTGLLLFAALLLGAFIYVYELRGGDPGEPIDITSRALFRGLKAPDVEWVELTTTDGTRVRAERDGTGWVIVLPDRFAADAVAFDGIASQLVGLDVQGRAEAAEGFEAFGVEDAVVPLRFEASGRMRSLRIGRRTPVGSNLYVRADDADDVAWVSAWRVNALKKSLLDLRDRKVIEFDYAAIDRVEVRWPGGRIEASNRGAHWALEAPVEEQADGAALDTLLSDLAFLRADGFLESPADEVLVGLGEPVLEVELRGAAATGEPWVRTIAIGAARDGRRAVRTQAGTRVLIDAARIEDFPREVLAYRFKTLGDFDPKDARRLTAEWAETKDEPALRLVAEFREDAWHSDTDLLTPAEIEAMLLTLSRLVAVEIVAEEVGQKEQAALGLDPPRLQAAVFDGEGQVLADVLLGASEPERGPLARRADSPTLYRLDPSVQTHLPPTRPDTAAVD